MTDNLKDTPKLTGFFECPSCANRVAESLATATVMGTKGWTLLPVTPLCMCKNGRWEMRKMSFKEE